MLIMVLGLVYVVWALVGPFMIVILQLAGIVAGLEVELTGFILLALGATLLRLVFPILLPAFWDARCRLPYLCKEYGPDETR